MSIDLLFYTVFLGQVLLISYFFPKKTISRNQFILNTYPMDEYPKLYQNSIFVNPDQIVRKAMGVYRVVNGIIALFGLGLLILMATSGYKPNMIKANEDMVFVMFFFLLQIAPHMVLEVLTYKWYGNMRKIAVLPTRTADLTPRRLSDFIPLPFVALAVFLYGAWLVLFVAKVGFQPEHAASKYASVLVITLSHFFLAGMAAKYIRGKKHDPHQARTDQMRSIKVVVQINTFSSILMSLFMIVNDHTSDFNLTQYEPVFLSLFLTLIITVSVLVLHQTNKIEDVDFSVYKADAAGK